jgi:hypothetical protein
MLSGISIICFAACYAIAFALEIVGLTKRFAWHRAALSVVTIAGLTAHTLYLGNLAAAAKAAPLSSPAEWLLLAAWFGLVYLVPSSTCPAPPPASSCCRWYWASSEPHSLPAISRSRPNAPRGSGAISMAGFCCSEQSPSASAFPPA